MMTPEPMPPDRRPLRAASTRTTAGPTRSTKAAMPLDTASSDAIASLGLSLSCVCSSKRSGLLRKIGVIVSLYGIGCLFFKPNPWRGEGKGAHHQGEASYHYEAAADRDRDSFEAAAGAELFRQRGDVKFHRMDRQCESARDLLVGRAFGKKRQHLVLPRAQVARQFIGCVDGISEGSGVFAAELLGRCQRITGGNDGNDRRKRRGV